MSEIKVRNFYNASCIKCNKIELIMVAIGAYNMCFKCHKIEFKNNEIVNAESITYRKWLKIYFKKEGKI